MLTILRQPYPTHDSPISGHRTALLSGLFVGLFLAVFQPFGLQLWQVEYKIVYLLGYGLVTLLVMEMELLIFRPLFSRYYDERRWTVGKEIFNVLGLIALIAFANLVYSYYIGISQFSWASLGQFMFYTLSIGIFITAGVTLATYSRRLRQNQAAVQALGMAQRQAKATPGEEGLTLVAENEKDVLEVAKAHLLYIESADNYVTVVHREEEQVHKVLLRSSLQRMEEQLDDAYICRTHRSYIINLHLVADVTGNAQGYRLRLKNFPETLPVSRKYGKEILQKVEELLA